VFDLDAFISDCSAATAEDRPHHAVKEVLDRVLRSPESVADALAHDRGDLTLLHHTADLTIVNAVWAPGMTLYPHDHRMWAAIGIYTGQEDNAFFRRGPDGIAESGGRQIEAGEVLLLGSETIHSVSNPRRTFTGAIHVYGGDFVNQPRSQWDPVTDEEQPFDLGQVRQEFARANVAAERDERDLGGSA
jgi:predicted metal-dependent enzyme (double-stranded beta helix superfamily)